MFGPSPIEWHASQPRSSNNTFPLAAFPAVFPILYYVTHTSLRYRHPIDPVVILLTTVGGGALVARWNIQGRTQEHSEESLRHKRAG